MGLRDKYIDAHGESLRSEKKLAEFFNDRTVDIILMNPDAAGEMIGKKLRATIKAQWENARKLGSRQTSEIKKQGINIVAGKKHYLKYEELFSIFYRYIFDIASSVKTEIEAEVRVMQAFGLTYDMAMNTPAVSQIKTAFMNRLKVLAIRIGTSVMHFGQIDGMVKK